MKMSKININIGSTDVDKLIKALNNLQKDLQLHADNIAKDVSEKGLKYLDRQYMSSANRNDPNIDIDSIRTNVEKTNNGYRIIAKGRDVIYEEFGTGDEGQKHQHPRKSSYTLDAYNSGKYIRSVNPDNETLKSKGITTGKYWTYKQNGTTMYTQGVRAGKEMWNTRNYITSKKFINEVVRKRGKEISDKFVKSIT